MPRLDGRQGILRVDKKPHWQCYQCSKPETKGADFSTPGFMDYCRGCNVRKGNCHWKNVVPQDTPAKSLWEARKGGKGGGKGGQVDTASIAAEVTKQVLANLKGAGGGSTGQE